MIILGFRRFAVGICAAGALLPGCVGSPAQMGAPALLQPASTSPNATKGDLLYVTGGCGGTCVFSYPNGKQVGHLGAAGASLCSDKSGNIFMPSATSSGNAVVYEYAHGGTTPIATLNLPGLLAEGCSVDSKSGDLAVTYLCKDCDYGPVAIFKGARGSPTSYDVTGVFLSYCGYDNRHNLFADGNGGQGFALLELPAGGSNLTPIAVNQPINSAGEVQWDGKHLAIEDLISPVIYRFQVSGSAATLVGTTKLHGAGTVAAQSWIQGSTVIVPFGANGKPPNEVGLWNYPAGGSPTKIIRKHLAADVLAGATVSDPH
ncbi:MAG: hypothetical protein WB681_02550 [Candidatus Cybelea sp.]